MGVVGEAIEHPSDLSKVSGRILERRMVHVFSFRTFLTEECFEMVHYAEPDKQCDNSRHYGSDSGAEMAATYHSVIVMVKLHGSSSGTSSEHFSKKSLTVAGIMLIGFLPKSLWLPANVNYKTNYLT